MPPRPVPTLDPNRKRTVVDCRPNPARLPTREKVEKFFKTNTEKREIRDAARVESEAIWEDDSHFLEDNEGNERPSTAAVARHANAPQQLLVRRKAKQQRRLHLCSLQQKHVVDTDSDSDASDLSGYSAPDTSSTNPKGNGEAAVAYSSSSSSYSSAATVSGPASFSQDSEEAEEDALLRPRPPDTDNKGSRKRQRPRMPSDDCDSDSEAATAPAKRVRQARARQPLRDARHLGQAPLHAHLVIRHALDLLAQLLKVGVGLDQVSVNPNSSGTYSNSTVDPTNKE